MSQVVLKMTPSRLYWLRSIDASSSWVRDCGRTTHRASGRRMPELHYLWLVENGLVECDCGNLYLSHKGREALAKAGSDAS